MIRCLLYGILKRFRFPSTCIKWKWIWIKNSLFVFHSFSVYNLLKLFVLCINGFYKIIRNSAIYIKLKIKKFMFRRRGLDLYIKNFLYVCLFSYSLLWWCLLVKLSKRKNVLKNVFDLIAWKSTIKSSLKVNKIMKSQKKIKK